MEGNGTTTVLLEQYSVYKKIQTNSYYAGEARKEETGQLDAGARIQVSEDEEDLLQDYFKSAVNLLRQQLTRYLGETTVTWDNDATHTGYSTVSFTVKSPTNFMMTQTDALSEVMEDEAVYWVLRDWLSVMKPGEEAFAVQKALEMEKTFRLVVNNRKKPNRT